MTAPPPTLPKSARAVIIGGGVVGCSVAYHLAKLGWKDVVLLERHQLTSGTTWHAAGLIGQLRATLNMTLLAKYSADLYGKLEAETGLATGYRQHGSVSLALTDDRLEELKRQASMAKPFGIDVDVLTPAECRERHPLIDLKDVKGGLFIHKDGQADPANIALALAKGARQLGARIIERVEVTGVRVENGRATGVETAQGSIAAEVVVNCAGLWGRDVGRMAGVSIPLMACEHFYVVTEPIPDLPRNLPVLRVTDECAYYKEDAGKLLVGFFEPIAKAWDARSGGLKRLAEAAPFLTLPDDQEHCARELELAVARVPVLAKTGIHTFFNGPESFTPDNRYLLGEAPEVRNFFVACGFNSVGIQSAGGAGKALAEWIDGGEAPFDLSDVDIRRMAPFQSNASYLKARVGETLGLLYADHWPYRHYASARGVRRTPLHERMAGLGAASGETAGWERPFWFAKQETRRTSREVANSDLQPAYTHGWKRQTWFENWRAEHLAVRTGVGIFDMSTFGKIRVEGRDAEAVLQRISANDVAVPVGRIVYTQWLNARGGIEADLTITRLSETAFLVVTSTAALTRDLAWLCRHTPEDAHCVITDVTPAEACLAVMGPRSRALLQALTPDDLSNEAFPFGTAREIEFGMARARAHRISYVGELGFELYVSADMAAHVFDALWEQGRDHGLALAGIHALDSCRLEKAYRHWGHDIGSDDHVLEAGLGFAVRAGKAKGRFGDFIGRDAVVAAREAGLSKCLVQFRLRSPEPLLYHNEPILRDGRVAGYLTSGSYGHHLGTALGMGYVALAPGEKPADALRATYEIEIACERHAAVASLEPFYDPRSLRVRD